MKSRNFTLLILFFTALCSAQTHNAGDLDTNFGTSGLINPVSQKNLIPYYVGVQPQTGEIMTAGNYRNAAGKTVGFIGRYDFYGNPKANFGTNGIIEISDLSTESQNIYRAYFESSDPNSAIYVRGIYKNGTEYPAYISKYLSNGTLDTSYGTNGSITGIKGQIYGNYIYSLDLNTATQHQSFKRYNLADGTLDLTFNNGDLPFLKSEAYFYNTQYENINIQADGKIILCGYSGAVGIIAKYDSTGHIDTSFGINGYFKTTDLSRATDISQTKTQSDGKIVFLNNNYNGVISTVLGRINANGTLDSTFGNSGYFQHTFADIGGTYIDNMVMQSDDKVLFCGSIPANKATNTSVMITARVSNTGTLDFWRNDLESAYSECWSLALIKDSYVLTFGNTTSDDYTKTFPIIQKLYLKSPIVSLNGSSLTTTDLDLTSTDDILFSKDDVVLSTGDIKFRLDHNDNCYWGSAISNPFPSGISTMGSALIAINKSSTYKVTFNIKTGAYSFTNTLGTIDHNVQKGEFAFYPNPTKEKLYFNENLKSIKVYAFDGKLINSNLINNEINVSNLPKGIYYFQAVTENDSVIGNKFIKE